MNVIRGMKFEAELPVFSGRQFVKKVTVKGIVTDDLCYSSDAKHWIRFRVINSSDHNYYLPDKCYKKQGKNFYPAVIDYQYPDNYNQLADRKADYKANLYQLQK